MRLSVPTIPIRAGASNVTVPQIVVEEAAAKLTRWLRRKDSRGRQGNVLVLTGAGISVDSGIRAYRGTGGVRQLMINATELGSRTRSARHIVRSSTARLRSSRHRSQAQASSSHRRQRGNATGRAAISVLPSYAPSAEPQGYPPVQHAEPNRSHFALAALQETGWTHSLITQSPSRRLDAPDRTDVDRLHHKAAPDFSRAEREILELHGSLKQIVCFSCQAAFPRDPFQVHLSELNPGWAEYADHIARKALDPKLNPDGDVDLEGKSYDDFKVPRCYKCGEDSIRPNVVRRVGEGGLMVRSCSDRTSAPMTSNAASRWSTRLRPCSSSAPRWRRTRRSGC